MNPITRILFATDFSESATLAEARAVALAQAMDAELIVLHVHYVPTLMPVNALSFPYEDMERAAKDALAAKANELKERAPKLRAELRSGYPSSEIVAAAKSLGVDLIVMGTNGRRGLSRMFLGSVAAHVVRSAPVPVLTVTLPWKEAPQAAVEAR